ncbi:hypothetical protein PPTG_22070 [Phytophthora nicotianae INRA-310]|uniref:Integrase catalytic domain-containing protein n=1 Tax=Phytophthora nicotianae (strain INRA-310) TaxID=761204 RepID=W2QS33_PHYN3|nr:hypothetical protein PPTG_22070 [Phytophthora nicotianae INRA-310]ETN15080.1 hypothetical protein PPTG_22070 [Phytophthora nicotianae INRA-310]
MLKNKIATAPVLRHFDPDRVSVVVVYASDWAISAALVQEHDGTYMPVTFTSRTLKPNELNYGMVEKEILALLRILDVCYSTLVTRPIKVLTLHSTLAWLMRSTGLQGRLGNWAALLSPWTLEIVKCTRGEDEILGTIAASITPRENVDSILSSIAPRKQPRQQISAVIPTVEQGEELLVVSFDGSARVKRGGGACSAIAWKLPEWIVVTAESKYLPGLTVNEAEYQGLLSPENVAGPRVPARQGKLKPERGQELLLPTDEGSVVRMAATTRSRTRSKNSTETLQLDVVQCIRADRILRAQNEEKWIANLKAYLSGDLENLDAGEAQACSKIADDYDVDDGGLPLYCPRAARDDDDRDRLVKLVVPEDLQQDVLHHYHTSLEGGHQGVGRTLHVGFFRAFNRIVGQRQRVTMTYRPQATGSVERMVQTLTRALKMYGADLNQKDWDEYVERLTFALNTTYDRVRGETPFYLVHGWDARSTLEATLPLGSTPHQNVEPRRWRHNVQRQFGLLLGTRVVSSAQGKWSFLH